MKWLATWIMNRIAGDGRSEWALAMRREFDELDRGHFSWAIGCVGAVCKKDVRENAPFLIAILLSAYFLIVHYGNLWWQLALYDEQLYRDSFFAIDHFGQVPFAFVLGFWRPTRAITITVLGGYLGYTMGGLLYVINSFGGSFSELIWSDSSYQVIGRGGENAYLATAVDLAVWYLAARIGGWLRKRPRRAQSAKS
jgi:hypothetical protein